MFCKIAILCFWRARYDCNVAIADPGEVEGLCRWVRGSGRIVGSSPAQGFFVMHSQREFLFQSGTNLRRKKESCVERA
jgi:hypothetical protein